MINDFPSFQSNFEAGKRRLRKLKKIATNKTGTLDTQDAFLFILVGNINIRLNTIAFLMANGISDGVFVLQRTIFELQLAFEAYSRSEEKDKFLELYFMKKDFESANKWNKFVQGASEQNEKLFSYMEREYFASMKKQSLESLKEITKGQPLKVWYELASGKSIKELSNEFLSELEYFASYDEPSNWVHPQRLEENMDSNLNQHINENYFRLLVGVIRWDVKCLVNDIAYIVKYLNISQSKLLYDYGEKMSEYDRKLKAMFFEEEEG